MEYFIGNQTVPNFQQICPNIGKLELALLSLLYVCVSQNPFLSIESNTLSQAQQKFASLPILRIHSSNRQRKAYKFADERILVVVIVVYFVVGCYGFGSKKKR